MLDEILKLNWLDEIGRYREADTQSAKIMLRLSMTPNEAHDLLGVSFGASPDEIKSAFRSRALKMHPDVNKEEGAEEKFKLLNMAYSLLKDRQGGYEPPRHNSEGAQPSGGESIHHRLKEWKNKFENDKPKIKKRLFEEVLKTELFQKLWNSKELENFYKYQTNRSFKEKNPNMDFALYRAMYHSFDRFFDNKFYEEYPSASFSAANIMKGLVQAKLGRRTINEAIQELMANQFNDNY